MWFLFYLLNVTLIIIYDKFQKCFITFLVYNIYNSGHKPFYLYDFLNIYNIFNETLNYYYSNLFQYLLLQKKKLEEERNALRKEVVALRIMQANYEQMVKAQQIPIGHVETRIPDEEKFQMVIILNMNDYYCIMIILFFPFYIFKT